jgi:hypothetical protein
MSAEERCEERMTAGVNSLFSALKVLKMCRRKFFLLTSSLMWEHDAKVAIKNGNTKNQVAITRKKM